MLAHDQGGAEGINGTGTPTVSVVLERVGDGQQRIAREGVLIVAVPADLEGLPDGIGPGLVGDVRDSSRRRGGEGSQDSDEGTR